VARKGRIAAGEANVGGDEVVVVEGEVDKRGEERDEVKR
jgi:hypothetical protein